jgi:hypothetical protein
VRGFPGIFSTTVEGGPSSKKIKANFQYGLGLRVYLGPRQGIRLFGELNTPISGLEEVTVDPQGSNFHRIVSRSAWLLCSIALVALIRSQTGMDRGKYATPQH